MRKSVLFFSVIAILLLVALFLGLRLWAADRAAFIVGPTAIHQGGNGVIYILSNKSLYLHDKEGNLLERIPMSKFGIDEFIGDFWVYKNGEILLRRPVSQKLSVSGEAEMFARTGAGEKDRLMTGESILQRCNTETYQCRTFGRGADVFDRISTFRLFVDEEKGPTYLADTIGHQMLMLDDNGSVIRRSNAPFKFPNQIELEEDGLLYIADTNNHRIAAIRTEKDNFGSVDREFRITHPKNPLKPTWPVAVAHAPDNRWWVINADDNMSDGIVMILNEKGGFEKVVPLPENADPLWLAVAADRVLVSDPRLMRVYSISQKGELQDDYGSLLFKLDLSELRRERRFYEMIATTSMGALLVLLAGALALARLSRGLQADAATKQTEPRAFAGTSILNDTGTIRYDYHSVLGFHRIKFAVITVILLAAFSFLVLISRGLTLFHEEFIPAVLLGHFVISFFTYLHLKRSYVELNEQGITYQGMSRHIHSPWNGVRTIRVYGSTSRIITDHGNFSIGAIEPADGTPRGWLDLFQRRRAKFRKELIEEVQKRAPLAKVNISWAVRYQWKRQ